MAGSNKDAISAALDDANRQHLSQALRDSVTDSGDDIWLVRELTVDSVAVPHWPPEAVAARLAGNISAALLKLFEGGGDGINCLHFPSRPAYLARFLVEAARGTAKSAWYFKEFQSMTLTTGGQALCGCTLSEPDNVRLAIQSLLPSEQDLVIRNTSASEAKRFLEILAAIEPRSRASIHPVLLVLESLAEAGELNRYQDNLALKLYFSAVSSQRQTSFPLAYAVQEIAETVRIFLQCPQPAKAIRAWQNQNWKSLREEVGEAGVGKLVGFLPLASEDRARLIKIIHPEPSEVSQTNAWTPFGASFLLLPLLDRFEWTRPTATWPDLGKHCPTQILQFLTVVGALGAIRADRTFNDPVLRECLAIDAKLTLREIRQWSEELASEVMESYLPAWIAGLTGTHDIDHSNSLRGISAKGDMAVDRTRGIWLGRSAPPTSQGEDQNITADEFAIGLFDFIGNDSLAEILLLTSQALLRDFTWRLPGFSSSSLAFIHENFFAFSATMLREQSRNLVFLSSPPLNIVLSLSGLNRKRFRLPYGGDLEWILVSR
jgi:hypothetical protein